MNWFDKHWGLACLAYLFVILMAGLWPFNPFPTNDVTWLEDHNGLRFGPAGIVVSSAGFEWPAADRGAECSLELFLEPSSNFGSNSILTFYTPEAREELQVSEWSRSILLIYKDIGLVHREMDIDNAFRACIDYDYLGLSGNVSVPGRQVGRDLASRFSRCGCRRGLPVQPM